MINYVVHPIKTNLFSIACMLLYYLAQEDLELALKFSNRLGEGFKDHLRYTVNQDLNLAYFMNRIIYSQMPDIEDFFDTLYFSQEYEEKVGDQILDMFDLDQLISSTKIKNPPQFESQVLQLIANCHKMNMGALDFSHDSQLIDTYKKYVLNQEPFIGYFEAMDQFVRLPVGSPQSTFLESDFTETFTRNCAVYQSYNIYFKSLNTLKHFEHYFSKHIQQYKQFSQFYKTLNIGIDYRWLFDSIEYGIFKILSPFYFTYHAFYNSNLKTFYFKTSDELSKFFNFVATLNGISPNVFDDMYMDEDFEENNITDDFKIVSYVPVFSLAQFYHLSSSEAADDLVALIVKIVFGNKNGQENSAKLYEYFEDANSKEKNDIQILQDLKGMYQKSYEDFDRGAIRISELQKFGALELVKPNQNTVYLDFGGGIGDIATSFAKKFLFKKQNVFVTDIKDWYGQEHVDKYSQYVTYRYLTINTLPFENNTFDMITCFQVLHHLPRIGVLIILSELYRVLKVGGYMIVREHACETDVDRMMIDVEHTLYNWIIDDNQSFGYLDKYEDEYFSRKDLIQLLQNAKFKMVSLKYPELKGVTKYYYQIWTK